MASTDRAQDRLKKIIKTSWSGLFSRIITTAVSLIIVPFAVHYLGKEQYGVWIAIFSFVSMLAFLDGGAGNAVINMVAYASGANQERLGKIVSTAFFSLMALALAGGLLFLAACPFVPWQKLLGLSASTSISNLNIVAMVVGIFFFVNIFATLVGKIQRGLQEGHLDNFWSATGAVLSLLFVYVAIRNDTGLVGFVIAFLAGSLLAFLGNNVHYLYFLRSDLRPQIAKVDGEVAQELFKVGSMFFVLQIAGAIQGQADNVLIANLLGPAEVTNYSICMKLFLMVPMLFGLLLTPLWPAYREALASGDKSWVKQIFFKSLRWSLLFSIPSAFFLVLFGGKVIELWVGSDVVPSTSLLIGCGIWLVLMTVGNALGVFLNGMQFVKIQMIVALVAAIMNVVLSIWFIQAIGVVGAVWGSIISYFIFTMLPCFFFIKKIFRNFDQSV
jgi:O-antigen/teichoic acid export membrane protein